MDSDPPLEAGNRARDVKEKIANSRNVSIITLTGKRRPKDLPPNPIRMHSLSIDTGNLKGLLERGVA